ncbi:AMP-binding protein [Actinoplanes sp. LDG1-06]|uniref:AMP-binding protein n=1 Tax=Paractinoplanes ovalisporus TaxID=2810368 RepID=A0ABS2A4C3_9ACTN|nr:AMP-binding protein [Actinoplanes ovalisporus]MBM2614697.1 AMP-binding protein [Actinoplanes ovalisporus]
MTPAPDSGATIAVPGIDPTTATTGSDPMAAVSSDRATAPVRRAVNLATLLTQTARRLPGHDALVHGPLRWTWKQLDERVGLLAAELVRRGVKPGDCVLLHSGNHVELVQTMFAVWRIGAVLAPTNSRLTPDEVVVIAKACRPVLMVCHASQPAHAEAVGCAQTMWIDGSGPDAVGSLSTAATGVDTAPSNPASPPSVATTPSGVDTTHSDPASPPSVATTPATAESVSAAVTGDISDAPVMNGAAAWYFFTSGTSGRPKCAILTHDQMGFVVNNHLCDLMPGTTERDASLVLAPLSHGAGVHFLTQVATGARSVLTTGPGLDGAEVWELVERERVSNMFTVPTILKKIAEHSDASNRNHSSLRHVIYAGAPMYHADQEHARAVLGDVLVQYYGLGEVTGNITVLPPHEHGRPRPEGVEFGTCGRVRTGMQLAIRDTDGNELGPGETGEVCVAGPAVCAGYLDNDEANAAAFRDGWFHTGDLGMTDEQGYLYLTGRASDMYISGGSNIHPRDIEEKLVAHPDVTEVAVLGMPHPVWGEVGVAVWVGTADADSLRAWLEPKMARYKVPRHFVQWPELPKSGYGKIVKRTIRERLLAEGWKP